jgi:hypothetical protein
MQIDDSVSQQRNACPSMHKSREPDSNVTVEMAEHPQKQPLHSFSTEEGMQMDESEEQF